MADSYCDYVASRNCHPSHISYHDLEYGFPVADDRALFERLMLEVNQAGLSWETILKRRPGFSEAYDMFDIPTVAAYGESDIARLLADARIIRNRAKVNAAITNARAILALQVPHGSFEKWLVEQGSLDLDAWVKLFRKTFAFTGPEIVREFLVSTGYLAGAHIPTCPIYPKIIASQPRWAQTGN